MALGQAVNLIGGAVGDLFAAEGHEYRAQGHRLRAQGQRLRASGQIMEAGLYDKTAGYARFNKVLAENSTEIKLLQEDRKIFRTIGGQAADVAASGFAKSGSALDIMRASAAEGALTKQIIGQQGLIEERSIEQQAESYDVMAKSSRLAATMSELAAQGEEVAARAEEKAAEGAKWSAGFKFLGSVVSMIDPTSLFTGQGGGGGTTDPTQIGSLY